MLTMAVDVWPASARVKAVLASLFCFTAPHPAYLAAQSPASRMRPNTANIDPPKA